MSAPSESANELLERFYDAMENDRDEECERVGRELLARLETGDEPEWRRLDFSRAGFLVDAKRLLALSACQVDWPVRVVAAEIEWCNACGEERGDASAECVGCAARWGRP